MKKLLSIIMIMMVSSSLYAINKNKFIENYKTWECKANNDQYSYVISGDTTINGEQYSKLYCSYYRKYKDLNNHYFAAIRQQGDSIYIYYNNAKSEILLYNFNMHEPINVGGWQISLFSGLTSITVGTREYCFQKVTMSDGDLMPTTLFYQLVNIGFKGDPFDISEWGDGDISLERVTVNDFVLFDRNEFENILLTTDFKYVPLVREGVQWTYYQDSMFGLPIEQIDTYEFKGDLIHNNTTYKKLLVNGNPKCVALMREADKKVYIIYDSDYEGIDMEKGEFDDEYLLYDFNIEGAGYDEYFEASSEVSQIAINGKLRQQYKYNNNESIIEGIGFASSNMTFFAPYGVFPPDGSRYGLSHVLENGEIVYKGPRYNDCDFFKKYGVSIARCDIDFDGSINVGDISQIYNIMLSGTFEIEEMGDINNDGVVNVGDVSKLYEIILGQ